MFLIDPDDMVDYFLVVLMGAVGKVEPEYIGTCLDELLQSLIASGSRPYCGHNFGFFNLILHDRTEYYAVGCPEKMVFHV